MHPADLVCPVCSYRFGPDERPACDSCPLNAGCGMLCCPCCGQTTIDPNRSRAARGLMRLLRWRSQKGEAERAAPLDCGVQASGVAGVPAAGDRRGRTLRDLPAGSRGRVCDFAEHTPARCREALTAYGVCPGQWLCVLRTSPVTVVEVDQLELALEGELAELIELDQLECPDCRLD